MSAQQQQHMAGSAASTSGAAAEQQQQARQPSAPKDIQAASDSASRRVSPPLFSPASSARGAGPMSLDSTAGPLSLKSQGKLQMRRGSADPDVATAGGERRPSLPLAMDLSDLRGPGPAPQLSPVSSLLAKVPKPTFPRLPASPVMPNQSFQSPSQVHSILSLPSNLLYNLARTGDLDAQQGLAESAGATPYLSSMTLPPPSPSTLLTGFYPGQAQPTSIGEHPALPILLGQVFSPPTGGIPAPFNAVTSSSFEPVYTSVEDWSVQLAREAKKQHQTSADVAGGVSAEGVNGAPPTQRPPLASKHSLHEGEVTTMAKRLQSWALEEQEREVSEQIAQSKEAAVILASQAAARNEMFKAASAFSKVPVTSSAPSSAAEGHAPGSDLQSAIKGDPKVMEALETAAKSIDLTAYEREYRKQLDALASGYFVQLHRDAVRRLSHSQGNDSGPKKQAINVQAAAASALTANIMAANEMASLAEKSLSGMGVSVDKIMPDRAASSFAPTKGIASLALEPSSISISPAAVALNKVPSSGSPHIHQNGFPAAAAQQPQQQGGAIYPPAAAPAQQSQLPANVEALLTQAEQTQQVTPEARDYLLSYAHTVYSRAPADETLLALLHTLENLHPTHLPTLLLLSCVYYTKGNFDGSLYYNQMLLKIDPNYVEAMSNMGTTLRAMGKWKLAEQWWWRAIRLRPTYADAFDNLLGVLCNPLSSPPGQGTAEEQPRQPRYEEALQLCEFVETHIFSKSPTVRTQADMPNPDRFLANPNLALARPRVLPAVIPFNQVHRLQNVFYAKGNLKSALGSALMAKDEYEKAIEIALSLPASIRDGAVAPGGTKPSHPLAGCSLRDLVVASYIACRILAAQAEAGPGSPQEMRVRAELQLVDQHGMHTAPLSLFQFVRHGGDNYVQGLLNLGGGQLPPVLLTPDRLPLLATALFPESLGLLPALAELRGNMTPDAQQVQKQVSQTTSTVLLTLAKIVQDAISASNSDITRQMSVGGIPPSQSLLLPLYYVALSLYASPSTCNNLGILLSTMTATTVIRLPTGTTHVNGQYLAMLYYRHGLEKDPNHSHLYTNLGSLHKDLGNLPAAIQHYKKAVECNPNFDVALANLGNALKDTGQIQESVPWYTRAVELNPEFPEAICGLANALAGICDWTNRGAVGFNPDTYVDEKGLLRRFARPQEGAEPIMVRRGYMGKISSLVDKQLRDGLSYGAGVMQACGDKFWLDMILNALGPGQAARPAAIKHWSDKLAIFFTNTNLAANSINEGGFIIRLVERLMRRVQRRWYVSAYGLALEARPQRRIVPTEQDAVLYRRPFLPPLLPTPPVPTVLPFHTFTYPVTARETRLISHRTGLRISHATLNQAWLPPHVYPPPPPPVNGKIKIGYVSSDFGNHPLSHLMQSVFGFHDRQKFDVFCYATSPSDKSPYRLKIEAEAQVFVDASAISNQALVERIVGDGIHVLVNLSGYTKGAKNEVFAARPCPVQLSYMGFAGTLAAGWCDYFIVDPVVAPPTVVSGNTWRSQTRNPSASPVERALRITDFEGDPDPESPSEAFVYTEKLMYLPHSYFVTDHKQAWNEGIADGSNKDPEAIWALEEEKRFKARRELFPNLPDSTVIFCNFNQLYKIDPFVFAMWLEILQNCPHSILWLLRFPAAGEEHLRQTALKWAGPQVAERIVFTDVATKDVHIQRGRVADLFLDTTECNAHTTAADILWSGTPLLTLPRWRHKLCSRVAASIALATGYGDEMIVGNEQDYKARALHLANSHRVQTTSLTQGGVAVGALSTHGPLADLRKRLFFSRETSPLFDTKRWVNNLEKGYRTAWERWVKGTEFEELEQSGVGKPSVTGCIWVEDAVDSSNYTSRSAWC